MGQASIGHMATTTWDGLLQGEELAHLTEVPARDAVTTEVPAELHPKVLEALA